MITVDARSIPPFSLTMPLSFANVAISCATDNPLQHIATFPVFGREKGAGSGQMIYRGEKHLTVVMGAGNREKGGSASGK